MYSDAEKRFAGRRQLQAANIVVLPPKPAQRRLPPKTGKRGMQKARAPFRVSVFKLLLPPATAVVCSDVQRQTCQQTRIRGFIGGEGYKNERLSGWRAAGIVSSDCFAGKREGNRRKDDAKYCI